MQHDDKHSPDQAHHDDTAEQAFSRLSSAWDPQQQAVADDEDRAIREQLEAVAMLAYGLEPAAPSAGAAQRLLDAVSRAPIPFRAPAPSTSASSTADPLDRTLQHVTVADAQTTAGQEHAAREPNVLAFGSRQAPTSSSGFGVMALAAALAFCLIGLGYLYGQLNAKNAEIAVQAERLQDLPAMAAQIDALRDQLRTSNDQLAMVSTVARQAYPLRRVGAAGGAGVEPNGRVFVCGQHQKWYMTVSGLEPAPSGQEYHLWFMTDDGPVDAGVIEVQGGIAALRDLQMPDDTEGFTLTLEPVDIGDQPQGRIIMIGDSPVKL